MKTNIPFINRVIAIIISIAFCLVLIPSFFSLPIELVLFNPETYHPVIMDEKYQNQYPEIITRLLMNHIYDDNTESQPPPVLANQENLSFAIKEHVPVDWAVDVILALFDNGLEFLNFMKPAPTLTINTRDLKSALILNVESITDDYLSSLPSCEAGTAGPSEIGADVSIFDLSPCKPGQPAYSPTNKLLADYLTDLFNQLPSETSIAGTVSLNQADSEDNFRTYSIFRWGFRLLPLISISLLIIMAMLLRNRRDIMFGWIGKLLVFVSGVCLFGLVILLIGFDQFIALTLNPLLRQLVPGFDVLMLGVIHHVGYQTIVWVIVTLVATGGFGLFLIFLRRFVKLSKEPPVVEPEIPKDENQTVVEPDATPVKEIEPETLEEIEESERKQRGRTKKKTAD